MKSIPFALLLGMTILVANTLNAKTAEEATPLLIGAEVPSVTLSDHKGKSIDLDDVLSGKSTVLIFYRGGWCPYCNTHLGELASIENDLKALGYQIVAISPDSPEGIGATEVKHELGYQLLSDSQFKAMEAFGVDYDNRRRGKLPVPSVFLITGDKRISFQYVNPNYRFRIPGKLILAAADAGLDTQ